jgi:ferric-dicitrate binding protein FerR (iron transport regulator)
MSHAPKLLALEAYASGLLSTAGAARVERHLGACARCNQALAEVRSYALLREDAERSDVPLLDWNRFEAALDASPSQAAAQAGAALRTQPVPRRSGKLIALAWPVLAIAATLVFAWIGMSGQPVPEASAPARTLPAAAPAMLGDALIAQVTLLAGSVTLEQDGVTRPLTLSSEVREGAHLITGPGAALHVTWSSGTGVALGESSSLRLAKLRRDEVELDLEQGSVVNQVHILAAGQRYAVRSGELSAHVRGTRFTVERQAASASPALQGDRVAVQEGRVEVQRAGQVLALLTPGQSYEHPKRDKPAPVVQQSVHGAVALHADWGTLQLPALGDLHAWIIDGQPIAPHGGLSLRLPLGSTQLTFEDARGQIRSVAIDLRERITTLEPVALAKLVAPKEARSGHLEPEQISRVIKAGVEPLRRCYERGLRVLPSLAGKLVLSVRVGADGRVTRAEPKGSELPLEVSRCISQEAGRMVFPKPEGGGAVSFEVPLNLKSH